MAYYVSSGQVSGGIILNNDSMYISNGGLAESTTVNSAGRLSVSSGGTANSTTVNYSGYLSVSSGGTANETTVNSGGALYVSFFGTATIIYNPWSGRVYSSGGADVTYLERDAAVYYGGPESGILSKFEHSALELQVAAGNSAIIFSGGTADNTTVNFGGTLSVFCGGMAITTIENGGYVSVDDDSVVTFAPNAFNGLLLSSGQSASVHSGTTANSTTVNSRGALYVYSGGTADSSTVTAGDLYLSSGGTANNTTINHLGSMFISNGGIANSTTIYTGGYLYVSSGGFAQDVIIYRQGYFYVSSGGTASHAFATGMMAWVNVYNSGMLESAVVKNGAELSVEDGGIVRYADVDNTAQLYVSQGGRLESASAGDWGVIYVFSGGSGDDITVDECGDLHVACGGTATRIRENGGCVEIVDGANVSFIGNTFSCVVLSSGSMTVHSGTTANEIMVTNGVVAVYDGGIVQSATLAKGSLDIHSGGTATGLLSFSDAAVVSAYDGSVIDFDISSVSPGSAPLVNDLSLIEGDPEFTITVSPPQTQGVYALAGGATGFDETVTVNTVTGTCLGTVSVGFTVTLEGQCYTLNLADALLSLTIENEAVVSGVSGDLNGDGRADVIMSITEVGHGAEGATGAWLILEDQTAAWDDLSTRNPGWEIFGTGKTAVGKNTDDVYIKSTDNVVGAWTTGDDGKVNGWETIGEFSADTQIVGLGDFNGNGQTDLLLRNTNGAVGCFFTGGETTGWNYFQSLGDEWKLSAVGDLNGDGRDDVVLKHDAGFAGSWLTQADGTMAWADLDTLPDGFEIVGAGDFDGDGTDDVLLKNGNYYGAWLVNNGNAAGWMGLGDLGDVTVEQIADFNGDGKDDLRIRTAAGDLGTQLVMGEDNLVWKYYGSVGSEWSTSLAALA